MTNKFFFQNPLSLVVGSRSARSWLVNGSFTAGKFLATLLLLLTLGVGNAWGDTHTLGWGSATGDAGTYTNFSATSGTVTGIVSFSTAKNSAGTAPAYNSGSSDLRLYYASNGSGGSITLTPATGITITGFKIIAASGYQPTTKYKIGSGSLTTLSSWSSNSTSASGLSVSSSSSITIQNCNTTNTQLRIQTIQITYTAAASGPTITTSPTSLSSVGYSTADFTQQVKSFTVSGSSLTASVTVTAPTNYEVCTTSGGTYSSSVTFDKGSGTLAASTVYVRLQSGKTAGNYCGNVACTSTGATTKNVAVSGSVPFTVTWKANGTTHATTYVTYATGTGTAIGTLPDDPDPSDYTCSPKAFYGWYDGESYSNASVAPSVISTSTKITTDKTYNAVFATRSGSAPTWTKVTSAPSDWSGDYVITNAGGSNAMISDFNSGTSGEFKSSSVTLSGSNITSTPTEKMIWTFAKNGATTQYSLKNKSTGTYAKITGTSSTNAALDESAVWFTISCSSGICIISSVSYSARAFAWYSTNSSFRTYANTGNTYCNLYKKTGGYTYSNYATSCCTPLGQINGSFFVSNQ